jgi:dimethylglycine dehydrogenase
MRWVCAYLEIEPDGVEDGHGGEPIMVDGQVMGSTASVAYGHTVGKILAFAYVRPEVNVAGKEVSVLIAGEPRAARILGDAAYDPTSALPRTDIAAE